MKKLLFISLIVLVSCNNSTKQETVTTSIGKIDLDAENACNYSSTLDITSAFTFKSDVKGFNEIVKLLTDKNFHLRELFRLLIRQFN